MSGNGHCQLRSLVPCAFVFALCQVLAPAVEAYQDGNPADDGLVNVTIRNGYEGWGVKVFLKNANGSEEEYAIVPKYRSITLQAYPGNLWVFKGQKIKDQWESTPFDQYLTTGEANQEYFCHDATHLLNLLQDGLEFVLNSKMDESSMLQFVEMSNGQVVASGTPVLRIGQVADQAKYVWIAHEYSNPGSSVSGWIFELKGDGRCLSLTDPQTGSLSLAPLAKKNGKLDIEALNAQRESAGTVVWNLIPHCYMSDTSPDVYGYSGALCLQNELARLLEIDAKSVPANLGESLPIGAEWVPESSAVYSLESKLVPSHWVGLAGDRAESGTNAVLANSQQPNAGHSSFRFVPAGGGYYYIECAQKSRLVLDISDWGRADQTNVHVITRGAGTTAQKFKIINAGEGNFQFVSAMGANFHLGVADDGRNIVSRTRAMGDRTCFKLAEIKPTTRGSVLTGNRTMRGDFKLGKLGPPQGYTADINYTAGLVLTPWGKDASKVPITKIRSNRDYFVWLQTDQPKYPPGRSVMNDAFGQGFVGDLLGNEGHSLTGYNVHRLNPLDLQDHGLRGSASLPLIFASIDPNSTNRTWYIEGGYRIPQCFFWQAAKTGASQSSTSVFFSETDLQHSFSLSLGFKGSVGDPQKAGISAGAKGGYSEVRRTVETENRVARLKTKWEADFWLTLDKQNAKLDAGFSDFLLDRNKAFTNYQEFVELFERYGTHYPLSVLYGGQFVEESYLESRSVMENLSTSIEASTDAAAGAKGVSGERTTSMSIGDTSASTIRSEDEYTKSYSAGGTGTTAELWSKGDSKNFAPIKIDLRPICEIIRPELFDRPLTQAEVMRIHTIRSQSYKMLQRYLVEEGQRIASTNRTPKMFVATVDYVKCTRGNDQLNVTNHAPDIYGTLDLGSCHKAPNSGREPHWTFNNNEDFAWTTAIRIAEDDNQAVDEGQMLSAGKPFAKHTFGVLPTVKTQIIDGVPVNVAEYDLENSFVYVHCLLKDSDQSGFDEFTIPGEQGTAYPLLKLSEVAAESSGVKTFKLTTEHKSAGALEIAITVRAVDVRFDNRSSMPKAPFGDE